jgi:hypothetical protein
MRKLLLSMLLFAGFASHATAADNYTATAGAGLTFGAKDAAGILYSRFIVCDNTTVSQCLAVDASGRLSIIPNTAINIAQINGVTVLMGNGATGTGSQRVTLANDNTIPTGWPTAANQTTANASIGTTADAACGTPDGTCSLIALTKYNNTATNSSVPAGTNLIGDVNLRQGGTALSATNGIFSNILQGNAVLSATNPLPVEQSATSSSTSAMGHASTTALGTSLVAKASAGNLYAYNCTGIAGGSAGYCIAYNGSSAPSTGALTGANVLDFCYYDTTARGCSLSRIPLAANYSTGIVILVSSATSPYTYTTGVNTAAISADFK